METQLQIRQNAQEIQEYMKDLYDWQKDIKKKEKKIKAKCEPDNSNGLSSVPLRGKVASLPIASPSPEFQKPELPYYKNQSSSSSPLSTNEPSNSYSEVNGSKKPKQTNAAAHTYSSYSKWDKFDVDAAVEAVEKERKDVENNIRTSSHNDKGISNDKNVKKDAFKTLNPTTLASAQANVQPFRPGDSKSSVVPAPKVVDVMSSPQSLLSETKRRMDGSSNDSNNNNSNNNNNNNNNISNSFNQGILNSDSSSFSHPSLESDSPSDSSPLMTPVYTRSINPSPSSTSPSPSAAAASAPPIRNQNPLSAEAWRLRGNDLFRAKEWAMARDCYDRSVSLSPSPAALSNRALTHLKLGDWIQAETDCEEAIQMDPKFVKAYLRRAEARKKLGRVIEAAEDFQMIVLLEPHNLNAVADFDAAFAAAAAAEGLAAQLIDWREGREDGGEAGRERGRNVMGGPRIFVEKAGGGKDEERKGGLGVEEEGSGSKEIEGDGCEEGEGTESNDMEEVTEKGAGEKEKDDIESEEEDYAAQEKIEEKSFLFDLD